MIEREYSTISGPSCQKSPATGTIGADPASCSSFVAAVMAEIDDLFIAVSQARSLLEAGARDPSLDASSTVAVHRGHEALNALWRGLLDPSLPFIDTANDEAWRQLTWRIGQIGERTGAATLAWECQTRLRELRGRPSPTLRQEELHARSQLGSRLGEATASGEGSRRRRRPAPHGELRRRPASRSVLQPAALQPAHPGGSGLRARRLRREGAGATPGARRATGDSRAGRGRTGAAGERRDHGERSPARARAADSDVS